MNKALFLDRDGVVNFDYGYVHTPKEFSFRPQIFDVCRVAAEQRYLIIIVTNQAGIARGFYKKESFLSLTKYMIDIFRQNGILIRDVYYSPYHPNAGLGHYKLDSYCRKPRPGMLIKACADHCINPYHSIMIGDSDTDAFAAESANIRHYVDAKDLRWDRVVCSLMRGA